MVEWLDATSSVVKKERCHVRENMAPFALSILAQMRLVESIHFDVNSTTLQSSLRPIRVPA
jgi:hypothetical protein